MEENFQQTLDLLGFYIEPRKVNISPIAFNKDVAETELRENFIKMLFCQEDRYEEFVSKKGLNSNTKTKYDHIYEEPQNLMFLINKIFGRYRVYISNMKEEPFPVDKYKFYFHFFNFLNYDKECKGYLKTLVKDTMYYDKFISRLDEFVTNTKNMHFHDGNAKSKLMRIIDGFIISMEID